MVPEITDEMVKAGTGAMCCEAHTHGCAAKHPDYAWGNCKSHKLERDARRCLEAGLSVFVTHTDNIEHPEGSRSANADPRAVASEIASGTHTDGATDGK